MVSLRLSENTGSCCEGAAGIRGKIREVMKEKAVSREPRVWGWAALRMTKVGGWVRDCRDCQWTFSAGAVALQAAQVANYLVTVASVPSVIEAHTKPDTEAN